MTIYELNPLGDPRWAAFIDRHPRASVFHTPGWLEALYSTYGYKPIAVTTTPQGAELTNGMVFCDVRSWLTGRRLVSLPFSDHCDPLIEETKQLGEMVRLPRTRAASKWVEVHRAPATVDVPRGSIRFCRLGTVVLPYRGFAP
jgi:CelD/BcsL family acetyltransferase involved in cellulose biosynthesis